LNLQAMKKIIILLVILVVLAGSGWFFRAELENFVVSSFDKIFSFKETTIDPLVGQIQQIEKQISLPPPLRLPGGKNVSTLTRAGVIAQTNQQRLANNLSSLSENSVLDQAAAAKANDMLAKQYFEHVSPSGVGPAQLAESVGYNFITYGENLALGNFGGDQDLVGQWMNSPGHRANILNSRFRQIGVAVVKGVYQGETTWLAVQEFGTPASDCPSLPDETLKIQVDANENRLDQLKSSIEAARQQIDNISRRDPSYNQRAAEYNNLVNQYNALVGQTKPMVAQYNQQVKIYNVCIQNF